MNSIENGILQIVVVCVLIAATVSYMEWSEHRDLTSQAYQHGYSDGYSEHNVTKYQDMRILYGHTTGITMEQRGPLLYERGYIEGYTDSIVHPQ